MAEAVFTTTRVFANAIEALVSLKDICICVSL